jgi:nucleoside-diphosphate-sugar epimerase
MTHSPSLALVTGGAGFIGSHLTRLLLAEGWRVRVLDNLSSGRSDNLPEGVDFIEGDIRDSAVAEQACHGAAAIFHLAALVSVTASIAQPALARSINLDGTRHLLRAAALHRVPRFVFSSSCAVYGDIDAPVQHEDLPPSPLSPYAETKLLGEQLAREHSGPALQAVCLRYFNIYGPRQNAASDYAAAIPRFVRLALRGEAPTIFGDGEQTRDFVYVEDIARANLLAATRDPMPSPFQVLNIGTGLATSVNLLWRHIADLSATPVAALHAPARPGEIRHSRASVERAGSVLGFASSHDLRTGLELTVSSLRQPASRP